MSYYKPRIILAHDRKETTRRCSSGSFERDGGPIIPPEKSRDTSLIDIPVQFDNMPLVLVMLLGPIFRNRDPLMGIAGALGKPTSRSHPKQELPPSTSLEGPTSVLVLHWRVPTCRAERGRSLNEPKTNYPDWWNLIQDSIHGGD